MSSRLRLQKDTAARKKAEKQALLEESKKHEQALFDSLQGTAPGTAVVFAGRPPDDALEDETPISGPLALNTASRGQKQTKQILVSDSDSEDASDQSGGGASDFSASQESQQSDSAASSLEESDEGSPPPAKRGKKSAASTVKASSQKTKAQATTSAPRVAKRAATSKAADAKKASNTLKSSTKQQTARSSAKKAPSRLSEVEETLPMKAQPEAGNAAAETAQPAAAAAAITRDNADMPTSGLTAPQDYLQPTTFVAPEGPADFKPKVAPSKGQRVSHGSMLPKHMTKGIQINSPGPAYKAPGLKRPQGGKPLH